VKPTVKIGLSAPFEGFYRDLGYEALHAVRLAVRERNAEGGVGQRYLVELVALNDLNEEAKAVEQARKMAVDPGVLGVMGGWSQETERAASEYEQLGLTFLTPGVDISLPHSPASVDANFAARYARQSGEAVPGPAAAWAYSAANRLMDAMDAATHSDGHPTRSGVRGAIASLDW
jgi:ABC-type branched-subunit amino acid transport system substrate-binding protein